MSILRNALINSTDNTPDNVPENRIAVHTVGELLPLPFKLLQRELSCLLSSWQHNSLCNWHY